jgi:hypothetical protein
MPSRASRAADKAAQDTVRRLQAVPDPEPGSDPDPAPETPQATLRAVPGPAGKITPDDPMMTLAADLAAALAMGGAPATGEIMPRKKAEPKPEPAAPATPAVKAKPKPAVQAAPAKADAARPPKPKPAPAVRQPAAGTPASAYDRHVGVVTLDGHEHTCEHAARNGHIEVAAAEVCARRLLRNYPGGETGTRLHPVRRDRNGARITA